MTASISEEIRDEERLALRLLEIASPALLASRALQKRIDRKFISPRSTVLDLLDALRDDFHIVTSNGAAYATYDTAYFDSPDLALFHAHRRGVRPRHKVRIRHYVERDVCFLETKTKDRYSVTTKQRFPRDPGDLELHEDDVDRIDTAIGMAVLLELAVSMRFTRITLVGVNHPERLTIDLGLKFESRDRHVSFDDVAIVEIKQRRFDAHSPAYLALRAVGLRAQKVSKYCVAMSVLGRVDRIGVFRPTIREIERRSHA